MVTTNQAATKLEEIQELASNEELLRDFNVSWESQQSSSDEDPGDYYNHRRIRFSEEIQDGLQSIIQDKIQSETRKIFVDETKSLERYHISNADREDIPLQFIEAEDIPHFDRFSQLSETDAFPESLYDDVPSPNFQTIRLKQGSTPRVVAFQKFTKRQILGKSWRLKFSLRDGEEYNIFRDNLMGIPERIDALYYDGLVFVFEPKRFEDIFDYVDEYETQANQVIDGLLDSNINIHQFAEFNDSIKNDRRALRKMHKVQERGVYEDITQNEVEDIIQEFDLDISVLNPPDGEWEINIPDMRKKWDVIRILNDDHVLSYITDDKFQVTGSKDER